MSKRVVFAVRGLAYSIRPTVSTHSGGSTSVVGLRVLQDETLLDTIFKGAAGSKSESNTSGRYPWLEPVLSLLGLEFLRVGGFTETSGILVNGVTTAVGVLKEFGVCLVVWVGQ